MINNVLVVGGYGGVGKYVVEYLLEHFNFKVIIGGRNQQKATRLKQQLLKKYPIERIGFAYVEAADKNTLLTSFNQVDLVIITATVPEQMTLIAEAAIESKVDLLDILIRGDVVDTLTILEPSIKKYGRLFITQCGFHPGIIAPLIRLASTYFDHYQQATVMMAMEGVFEQPEAIKEIIHEVIKSDARILSKGVWKKANYRYVTSFDFGSYFGQKQCYPAQMREIHGIDKQLGLTDCAVYASGFNSYIDNFIFPLAVTLGLVNKALSISICSKLFFNSIKPQIGKKPQAKIVLNASGSKEQAQKKIRISLTTENSFQLTAIAITALLNQYLNNTFSRPGLHLMGKIANETWLFKDMTKMGVKPIIEQV